MRAIAIAQGSPTATASVADKVPSPRLNQIARMNSGLSAMARKCRSDRSPWGSDMYPSDVNATAHTITSGASMNTMNNAWKARLTRPLRDCMATP